MEGRQDAEHSEIKILSTHQLKIDQYGIPLRPQPSAVPSDPLNWSAKKKILVLSQVSFLAFLGPFSQAMSNSAYAPLAADMNVSIVQASYQNTVAIIFAAVAPIFWSPIANAYGRRIIFLTVPALGIIALCGSAVAKNWTQLLIARAFVGIGTSAGIGIGASVVSDMYFMAERGKYMGVYSVMLVMGIHLAPICGGHNGTKRRLALLLLDPSMDRSCSVGIRDIFSTRNII